MIAASNRQPALDIPRPRAAARGPRSATLWAAPRRARSRDPGRLRDRAWHPARDQLGCRRSGDARRHRDAHLFRVSGDRDDHGVARAMRSRRPALARVRIETRLSPAWTTDWITPKASGSFAEFGIAPPGARARDGRTARSTSPASVRGAAVRRNRLPALRVEAHELVSQFGSTACKAHYRCLDCLEPFDYFKPH